MHANEAGRFADESGRPRKKEGRLFLTRSHPVPRFFEQHACTHTWNLVTGDQGKKLSLSLSRFFFYVTRSHQDHPHCHPPFRFHCRLSPLPLQPRHRCKLHAYAITLHIYMYVYIPVWGAYSSICCIVQLTYHAIGACTSRHCPLSTRLSSMPSSSSNELDMLDNVTTREPLLKPSRNNMPLRLQLRENCENFLCARSFFVYRNGTRFRNFREICERYASSSIQAAPSDSPIWISKISKGLRVSSGDAHMSDAGQSVRGKIFKVNSGRDCVFQNSYLNPFSA